MASRSRQTQSIERNGLKRPGVRALQQPVRPVNSHGILMADRSARTCYAYALPLKLSKGREC